MAAYCQKCKFPYLSGLGVSPIDQRRLSKPYLEEKFNKTVNLLTEEVESTSNVEINNREKALNAVFEVTNNNHCS